MTITNEIWHGDSRELIANIDEPVNCVITDPPYGVDFVSHRAVTPHGKTFAKPVANDGNLDDALDLFYDVMDELLPKTSDLCDLYVFTRWDIVDTWLRELRKYLDVHDFKYKMLLIWDKGVPGMGDIDANWGCGHEEILYFKKGLRDVPYRRSGIIAVDKVPNMQHIHPTEKPVGLIEKLVEMSTDEGDLVVDPFSGSGSTVVAARNLGRRSLGIEYDEDHANNSRNRLSQLAFV